MFKIRDGKIKVFSKYVTMKEGKHILYVNKDTGSVSHTENSSPVVEYSNVGGVVKIRSLLEKIDEQCRPPTKARSWKNGRKISSGPLFEEPDGAGGKEINVYMEGFAFDFSYNAVAHVVTATKPFRWTGGRVCFSGNQSQGNYTAIPAAGMCGPQQDFGASTLKDIGSIYSGMPSGLMATAQKEAMVYHGNAVSVVFSYRSFRKYMSWARGLNGIFECSLGAIGSSGGSVEPEGVFPSAVDSGFRFSMFSLKQ